jgi:non-ribosomal peptide synthetase component F
MTELLQDWVAIQADTRPHASAIVMGEERVTYGQLEARSNQLARTLEAAGCRRGDRICLLMPKSPTAVTAVLSIFKAGCIFVPVDSSASRERVAHVLASCEPRCVLAAGPGLSTLDALGAAVPLVTFHDARGSDTRLRPRITLRDIRAQSTARLGRRGTRDDAAHILFDFDSGGGNGVVMTHGNVMHFVEWARQYFGMSTSDRISGYNPLDVNLAMFDIFGTFAAGAELHLVALRHDASPGRLADVIRTSELTQWFSAPAVLEQLVQADAIEPDDFPTLKRVLWSGGVLGTETLIHWMTRVPHVAYTHLYGRPDVAIASGHYTVVRRPGTASEIPIGTSCEGQEFLVLDDQLEPVAVGATGELYIRGVGLGQGYWRNEDGTGHAFVTRRVGERFERLYRTGDLAWIGSDGLVHLGTASGRTEDVRVDECVVPSVSDSVEVAAGDPPVSHAAMAAMGPRR